MLYLKTRHPTLLLLLLLSLRRAQTFTSRLSVNNRTKLGLTAQQQEPSGISPAPGTWLSPAAETHLLFGWCPKISVHHPNPTQERLGGTEWAHEKEKDRTSKNWIFYAGGSVSKPMPFLLKINCLKQYMTLKLKFAAHSFQVLNCVALIPRGISATT